MGTTAVKAEPEIKKEEPMDTNDKTLFEPKKADDAESTSSTTSSPTPPLFTLTPLVQLDLPRPAPQDKTNEEATVDVSDKEMTGCEEFSCRLVLLDIAATLPSCVLGTGSRSTWTGTCSPRSRRGLGRPGERLKQKVQRNRQSLKQLKNQ